AGTASLLITGLQAGISGDISIDDEVREIAISGNQAGDNAGQSNDQGQYTQLVLTGQSASIDFVPIVNAEVAALTLTGIRAQIGFTGAESIVGQEATVTATRRTATVTRTKITATVSR